MGGPVRASASDPAVGLLAVARLRVECIRIGVTEVSVTPLRPGQRGPGGTSASVLGSKRLVARLSPVELPASAKVRLRRLHPDSVLKEGSNQLIIALSGVGRPSCSACLDPPRPPASRQGGRRWRGLTHR